MQKFDFAVAFERKVRETMLECLCFLQITIVLQNQFSFWQLQSQLAQVSFEQEQSFEGARNDKPKWNIGK